MELINLSKMNLSIIKTNKTIQYFKIPKKYLYRYKILTENL